MNQECVISKTWYEYLATHFGEHLASKAVDERHVILVRNVSVINERYIHADIRPFYRELRTISLTASDWVDMFTSILQCRGIPINKVGIVYRQIFETLTGKSIDDTTFQCLPAEEKELWLNEYVQDDDIYKDPAKLAEYNLHCAQHVDWLLNFCKEKCIRIPGYPITEIPMNDELTFKDISVDLQKHSEALDDEIRKN